MIFKQVFRVFFNREPYFNRTSYLMCRNGGFLIQKAYASENVLESRNETSSDLIGKGLSTFKEYILKNNNFKHPVNEISNLNFAVDSNSESFKLLLELKKNIDNSDLGQEVINCLSKELNTFGFEDLLKVGALIGSIAKKYGKSKLLMNLTALLDAEIQNRNFQLDELLEVLFVLRHSAKNERFHSCFHFYFKTWKLFPKMRKLNFYQIIQLFYFLLEFSPNSKRRYKYDMYKYVKENLSLFNVDEMTIVLVGLSRAKLGRVDSKLIQAITKKVLADIENVESKHLFYICKYLENCSAKYHSNAVTNFQEKLIPYISKFHVKSLMTGLFSNYPFSLSVPFWEEVSEVIKRDLNSLTLLDMGRIAKITTAFKVESEELLKLLLEKVEEMECFNSPHLSTFCKQLILHRIYSKKLLEIVLKQEFVKSLLSRSCYSAVRDWTFLNYSLELEKPSTSWEYHFWNLDEELKQKILKKSCYYKVIPKNDLCPIQVRNVLRRLLKNIYGENEVLQTTCLPHFENALIMRFDRNLKPLPIPEEYKILTKKTLKKPTDDQLWICVSACNSSAQGLTPLLETYARHLSIIGYIPVLLIQSELFSCSEEEGKKAYLKIKIEAALEEALQEKQTQKQNFGP